MGQLTSKKILSSPGGLGFDIFMTLLSNGTEIDLKRLNTNTPWGRALANIKITFPKDSGDLGLLSIITSIAIDSDIRIKYALALHLLEKFYQNIPSSKKSSRISKTTSWACSLFQQLEFPCFASQCLQH